jgi:hypothetical protein
MEICLSLNTQTENTSVWQLKLFLYFE